MARPFDASEVEAILLFGSVMRKACRFNSRLYCSGYAETLLAQIRTSINSIYQKCIGTSFASAIRKTPSFHSFRISRSVTRSMTCEQLAAGPFHANSDRLPRDSSPILLRFGIVEARNHPTYSLAWGYPPPDSGVVPRPIYWRRTKY